MFICREGPGLHGRTQDPASSATGRSTARSWCSTTSACRPTSWSAASRARASTTRSAGSSSAASTSPRAASGIATGALQDALRYAQQRETFGKPICRAPGDPAQARRHGDARRGRAAAGRAGRAQVRHRASAATWRPAWRSCSPPRPRVENSLEAMRIFGGYGYSKEFDVERYLPRRAADVHRRGHQRDAAHHHRPAAGRAEPG